MKPRIKGAVERMLHGSGLPHLTRWRRRRDAVIHIGQRRFRDQLLSLQQTHAIVPLDRVFESDPGGPRAAITFDDAYRGALTAGLDVLRELDLPATVFVVTGAVGGDAFWWDRLGSRGFLTPATRERALVELRGEDHRVAEWERERGQAAADLPDHALPASAAELEDALAFEGLTLGSHTASHPSLVALGDDEVDRELVTSREWLEERFGDRTRRWITYPYGHWSPGVAARVERAGYTAAFAIDGGWLGPSARATALPRLNVPAGLSWRGLALRTSGLVG
jgi:peptidoglycan/xylan/chitin deacetylase (PgdA/CDA1 family)